MLEAHFGLTPKRYSSGQTDYDGRISRCGDEMVRTALYQAANVLLHHGRWSSLRSWAMRIAKRGSVKGAKVASMRPPWSCTGCGPTEPDFQWSDTSRMTAADRSLRRDAKQTPVPPTRRKGAPGRGRGSDEPASLVATVRHLPAGRVES